MTCTNQRNLPYTLLHELQFKTCVVGRARHGLALPDAGWLIWSVNSGRLSVFTPTVDRFALKSGQRTSNLVILMYQIVWDRASFSRLENRPFWLLKHYLDSFMLAMTLVRSRFEISSFWRWKYLHGCFTRISSILLSVIVLFQKAGTLNDFRLRAKREQLHSFNNVCALGQVVQVVY